MFAMLYVRTWGAGAIEQRKTLNSLYFLVIDDLKQWAYFCFRMRFLSSLFPFRELVCGAQGHTKINQTQLHTLFHSPFIFFRFVILLIIEIK